MDIRLSVCGVHDRSLLNKDSDPTFLSFGGATSHPDLVLAHPNLLNQITHTLLPAPGGARHKLLVAELNSGFGRYREPRFPRWNLKKANWTRYQDLTDYLVREVMTDETDNADRAVDKFTEIILACAISCIPREQRKMFSPFWNKELHTLKENRDKARNKAESTGMMSDCIELRKQQTCLRRAIREAKRQTYRGFVENLDFRRGALSAHQFLSRLNNQKEKEMSPLGLQISCLHLKERLSGLLINTTQTLVTIDPTLRSERNSLGVHRSVLTKNWRTFLTRLSHIGNLNVALSNFLRGKVRGRMVSCLNFLLISLTRQWEFHLN
ncbi:uncharacterized protein TNCT_333931 [Trichonephila clavata]|uniref:Uncharacterized protein n=1 Tax=Trichonephila clavata TaxID=2740835 RepID=A0A8X6F8C1_TRICU|nr:uncharacterized protein TNCT_333931 [Trichonephila clavata]